MLKPAGSFPIALMAMPLIGRPACSRWGAGHKMAAFAGAVHGGGLSRGVLRIKSLYSRVVNNYSFNSFNYGSEDKND
jgi:hypothetical protein